MDNNKLYYSVSVLPYDRNADVNATNKLQWVEKHGTISSLANDITNNYAFCPCFYHNGVTFTNAAKKDSNLKGVYFITLDLDAVKYSASEFFNLMNDTELAPSIVYTTANNGKIKKDSEVYCNRYRVIYALDVAIHSKDIYKAIQQAVKHEISLTIEDNSVFNDNTDSSVSHFFAGNNNAEIYVNDYTYSVEWLKERYNVTGFDESATQSNNKREKEDIIAPCCTFENKAKNEKKEYNYIQEQWMKKTNTTFTTSNTEFITDFYTMPLHVLQYKWANRFENITATEIHHNSDDMITFLPSDYCEIKYNYKIIKDEESEHVHGAVKRIKNGNGRRKKLYMNLLLRKKINPSITFETLLYDAVFEVVTHIDNTDLEDKITKEQISQITVNAFNDECTITTREKRKYVFNKKYCAENGIDVKTANIKFVNAVKKLKKQERDAKIKELYSAEFTDVENLDILKENGIIISLRTLKAWKKENGIKKYKKA